MRKRLINYTVILLLIIAATWWYKNPDWLPSFTNIFKSKPLEIENTAIIIKEINSLAQLITITAYNEVVLQDVIKGNAMFNNPVIPTLLNIPDLRYADKKLVLIGKGRVLAGIDLKKLTDKDIFIKDDSIAIHLPAPQILQVIINPSDYEIFEETGQWSDQETTTVKIKLRDKLVATVLQQNILQQAGEKAKSSIENFAGSLGYKKVSVSF